MGETVQLRSAKDGFAFDAYRAVPTDARRGGLVICHAIWGVTPHLRELADGFAEDGYETLVPSLFDRLGKGFAEQNTDPALYPRQDGFARATHWGADVLDLVQASIDALAPQTFLLGFCFGGTTAWLAAARCTGLSAVASYYGGQITDYLDETPKVPTILHLGKTDELIPPADVEAIRAAHPDLPVYMYEAGHAFVAPNGFHADSARLSHLRTMALFARNGAGRGGDV
ncbi:MAG: dienelactone hydrolase family protein [Alphaproteobacteria bacterium]|nr:dienelactone hydrolase family protein [Alphaproteobacteria bacterium]MBU1515713.1 dienelactone hydrolase family protein [Alphaproteobacteria bacterium]MBU2096996.1 dienelactone hydrolase family protein [Alphaproteobacteria bacterium]MBU2149512.1 dienelactone hydrolase family protein [Alphaproteobacteria bacterium]MBU2308898.1 dienelactone hydrolase family protein [Alphaproteobacteria bacterium]